VVQVPSGFCTRVLLCVGVLPEGHTGLPDSKVGLSKGLKMGILLLMKTGGIVGMEFWFEVFE
jgi:hypothetical protein